MEQHHFFPDGVFRAARCFYTARGGNQTSNMDVDSGEASKHGRTSLLSGLGSHRQWLEGTNSRLLRDNLADKDDTGVDDHQQKELKLRFDVSLYTPEEIMVKTVDNKLMVRLF